MSLVSVARRDPDLRPIALALACGVPLAAYLATASAGSFWLDGGELAAQAIRLDIAHPPGHPLAGLVGKLFTLLPLGPLDFRVALAQAFCAAGAAGFFFTALTTTVRALGVRSERLAMGLALGGTWTVACSYGWWFQAVRPEVYALQALLVCVAIERIVRLEAAWPTMDVRPLYTAALALGLGLANHHLVAFLVMPALAPTLARVYRARGARPLALAGLGLALGLASYLYLPVRAATDPPANLGDPTDAARLFWVVSARVYSDNVGTHSMQPLGERLMDVLTIPGANLAAPWIAADVGVEALRALLVAGLVALGAYAILRTPGARRIGLVWVLVVGVNLPAPAWIGTVRGNPDVLGYMMPGVAACGALIVALVAALLARIGQHPDGRPRFVSIGVAVLLAALGVAQLVVTSERASLARFHATDPFDEERIRRLPPFAVVVLYRPQTVFRHWDVDASERVRPDVTIVPMPFLNYPGVVEQLFEQDPDVTELLRGYLLEGELRQPDLQSLASRRPLLIEMDVRVPRELYETMVPAGLFYEVVDAGATDTDVLEAADPHGDVVRRVYSNLGPRGLDQAETRTQLTWIHYMDALYYAAVGAREPGRQALALGLALAPESQHLRALGAALEEGEGPIDITPFRVGPDGAAGAPTSGQRARDTTP